MYTHYYPGALNINCKRAVFYRQMVASRRASVSEVLKPSQSGKLSDLYLSDKAKARVSEVKQAIQDGTPLYTKDDLEKEGKSTIGQAEHKRLIREPTPEEIRVKEEFWRSGASINPVQNQVHIPRTVVPTTDLERELGIPEVQLGPAAPQYQVRKYKTGEKHTTHFIYCSWCGVRLEESQATRAKTGNKVACPDHSLKIRNVKFMETVG